MGMVSTLAHFLLEPCCTDYFFLDQTVEDFEQGLDSIIMDSVDMPELDTSLDDAVNILSSVL